MKIPFTLEAWLKDKSQKVETGEGESVHILCTNADGVLPIIGNVGEVSENLQRWTGKGQFHFGLSTPNKDLFIVTPEEELSEFESGLFSAFSDGWQQYLRGEEVNVVKWAKEHSLELLALAKQQLIHDGYVIEKKAFHDAFENISDKHRAEMSVEYSIHCKVEDGTRHAIMNWEAFQKVAQKFIEIGKAEALKDLPRWEKQQYASNGANVYWPTNELAYRGMVIRIDELTKLPGFKEDKSHE